MHEVIKRYIDLVNSYVKPADWKVSSDEKGNFSIGGLILSNSGAVTENYWLSEVYDPEIAQAHKNGLIHIHDLSMLTGRSAGWSLKQLISEGLGGVGGKLSFGPARHLAVLCNQMVSFMEIMQNEWSGAQSFSSFDTYLAPYVRAEDLNYRQVRQCIESFVFGVNVPSRWGTQPPFCNITMDWRVPADLADVPAVVGGEEMDFTYGDCQAEMDMINQAFLEIMIAGDSEGQAFRYPIPTYAITEDFDWSDTDNNRLLFEMTAKYGTPYFANHIFSDRLPEDARRDEHEKGGQDVLLKKSGGYFGYGEYSGSIGAVTVNLPRIAWLSGDENDFYRRLDEAMDLAARSLKIKRGVLTRLLTEGLYPYTKRYMGTYDRHYSSIGPVGINEACLNAHWLKRDLWNPTAQRFAKDILQHMKDRLIHYQHHYGDLFELEATPAESAAFAMARKDRGLYPEIVTAGKPGDTPYYTSSSQLPSDATTNVQEALSIQDGLQSMYTGGTAFHIYLSEQMKSWTDTASLVRYVAENYELPYFTISPIYSMCPGHGYLKGTVYECPVCGQKTNVFCRIAGYYHPMDEWNDGKLQEFKNRRNFLLHPRKTEAPVDVREDIALQLKEDADAMEQPTTEEIEAGREAFNWAQRIRADMEEWHTPQGKPSEYELGPDGNVQELPTEEESYGLQIEGDVVIGPFSEADLTGVKPEPVRTEEEADGQLRFADMEFESEPAKTEEPEPAHEGDSVPENQMTLDFTSGGWKSDADAPNKRNPGELPNGWYLFAAHNDPNSMYARELLGGKAYREFNAYKEPKLVQAIGIRQAPAYVHLNDGKVQIYTGIKEIRELC